MVKALIALAVVAVIAVVVVMLVGSQSAHADRCGPGLEHVPATPAGWAHKRSRITVTHGSPRHRVQDVIAPRGGTGLLVGKFAYGKLDKDLKRETVRVLLRTDRACGPWSHVGDYTTSENGEHGDQHFVVDDGGRIFVPLGPEVGRGHGQFDLKLVVLGDHSSADASLFRVTPKTQTVLFDIDGTLTIDDKQITKQVADKLVRDSSNGYTPKMWPDAPKVARAWAQKGYLVAYVTGRPDNLKDMTRQWLIDKGFPPGPLRLADGLRQVLPGSSGVGAYKTQHFSRMIQETGLDVVAAYGNATTDVEAYAAIGLPLDKTYIIGPNAGHGGTTAITSYTEHLPAVIAAPTATVPAPPKLVW